MEYRADIINDGEIIKVIDDDDISSVFIFEYLAKVLTPKTTTLIFENISLDLEDLSIKLPHITSLTVINGFLYNIQNIVKFTRLKKLQIVGFGLIYHQIHDHISSAIPILEEIPEHISSFLDRLDTFFIELSGYKVHRFPYVRKSLFISGLFLNGPTTFNFSDRPYKQIIISATERGPITINQRLKCENLSIDAGANVHIYDVSGIKKLDIYDDSQVFYDKTQDLNIEVFPEVGYDYYQDKYN